MQVTEFLDKSKVKYKVTKHEAAFTAQSLAAAEHEQGKYVAKPVIIKADKKQLGAKSIELVEEKEVGEVFPDCELGAEPPFGNLYDLPTVMDKSLMDDDHITFQAGSHEKAVRMSMKDYRKLVEPEVLEFSYHVTS